MFCSTMCGLLVAFVIGVILYGRKQADTPPETPPEPAATGPEPPAVVAEPPPPGG